MNKMAQHKHKISLSNIQRNKLRVGYKKQKLVVLTLKNDQLKHGNVEVLLNDQQHRQVEKAIKNGTGIRLILEYTQLKDNVNGGLLKEILEMAENSIPYFKRFASPLIKDKVAPALKNQFIPWLKKLVDEELDTLMTTDPTGAGLRKRINNALNQALHTAHEKKI